MKKAFTLIELLVVIAIIAILAAMLMPALTRARMEAQRALCQSNEHNIGLGWAMLFKDIDDWTPEKCNAWDVSPDVTGVLAASGYIDDLEVFDCPSLDSPYWRDPGLALGGAGTAAGVDTLVRTGEMSGQAYFADESRIKKESFEGRAILADSIEMMTIAGAEPANHADDNGRTVGANLLFVDMAVQWQPVYRREFYWDMDQVEVEDRGGIGVSADAWGGLQDWYPQCEGGTWRRWGFIQNGRLLHRDDADTQPGGGEGEGEDDIDNAVIGGGWIPDWSSFTGAEDWEGTSGDVDDVYYVELTTADFSNNGANDNARWGFISYARGGRCVEVKDKSDIDCAVAGGHIWWWRYRTEDDYSGMTWGWPTEFKNVPVPTW